MSFSKSEKFEVLIVGGGVVGLSIARELRKTGVKRIAIFEKNETCGAAASAAAAGMLAPQTEADEADDFFRLCQQSRDLYPNFAAELCDETGIDVELDQTGTLYLAFYESDLAEIEKRFTWQRAASLKVEKLSAKEILEIERHISPAVLGGLCFPSDWQVENRRLVAALIKTLDQTSIFYCAVKDLLFENKRVCGVQTSLGNFWASAVVIAAGAWTSLINFPAELNRAIKIKPIRGQMLGFQAHQKSLRHVIHTPRGYLVPRKDNRILVGATVEDNGFSCHTSSAGINSLLELIFEILPNSATRTYLTSWAGLRPKTSDGLPLLGEYPRNSNLYFATGHYRNGILLAPLTAKLIADKIVDGTDSAFFEIFNPNRFLNNS